MKHFDSSVTVPNERIKSRRYEPTAHPLHILATWAIAALVGGGVVYVGAGFLCMAFHWDAWPAQAGAGATMLFVWLSFLWKYVVCGLLDDALYIVEKTTHTDLNQDGVVGAPQIMAYELHAGEGTTFLGDLPAPPEVVMAWGQAALGNRASLAYRSWSTRFDWHDTGDGEQNYRAFREELVKQGLATEGGTHGINLTHKGRALFTAFVERGLDAPSPLLDAYAPKSATRYTHTQQHTE